METAETFNRNDPFVIYLAAEKLLKSTANYGEREEINLALIARIQTGDRPAVNELIVRNFRLVKKILHEMVKSASQFDDCAQGGIMGLVQAAYKFDLKLDFAFSTYAVWWIRAGIQQVKLAERTIHLSSVSNNGLLYLMQYRDKFRQERQSDPTRDELARELACREHRQTYKKEPSAKQLARRLPRCLTIADILLNGQAEENFDEAYAGWQENTAPADYREGRKSRDYEKLSPLDYCLTREELKYRQELLDKIKALSVDWRPMWRLILEKLILALPDERISLRKLCQQGVDKNGKPKICSPENVRQIEIKIIKKLTKHFKISRDELLALPTAICKLTELAQI